MVPPAAQGYAARVERRSWTRLGFCCWWALWGLAPAHALEWSTLGPLASPPTDERASDIDPQGAVAGLHGAVEWTARAPDPLAVRALTEPRPGGTFYARAQFESSHAGPVAVRLRSTAALRVWLDGRLIGGRLTAAQWRAAPLALPAALEPGAHTLLVELRPATHRPLWLAGAITTPTGAPIATSPTNAPARPATTPAAPIALAAADAPPTRAPTAVWQPPMPTAMPLTTPPDLPPIESLRALPVWPDAPVVLLADLRRWVLDTRAQARSVALRVQTAAGLAAARALLSRFDAVAVDTPDGWLPVSVAELQVGAIYRGTLRGVLPDDPLRLGAARLAPLAAPVWRWRIDIEAPRAWSLAVQSRGLGGARIDDTAPGRRVRRIAADAVEPGSAALRVSRVEGAAGFAAHARAALRDDLRAYPGQPACAPTTTPSLSEAIDCARAGRPLYFVRAPGRPPLDGPVDLADFDALRLTPPGDDVAYALDLDGRVVRGPGIRRVTDEVSPAQPRLRPLALGGPCGEIAVAARGALRIERAVVVSGMTRAAPKARRMSAGPLAYERAVTLRPDGWQEAVRLSWRDLDRWTPRRVRGFCRALEATR